MDVYPTALAVGSSPKFIDGAWRGEVRVETTNGPVVLYFTETSCTEVIAAFQRLRGRISAARKEQQN